MKTQLCGHGDPKNNWQIVWGKGWGWRVGPESDYAAIETSFCGQRRGSSWAVGLAKWTAPALFSLQALECAARPEAHYRGSWRTWIRSSFQLLMLEKRGIWNMLRNVDAQICTGESAAPQSSKSEIAVDIESVQRWMISEGNRRQSLQNNFFEAWC